MPYTIDTTYKRTRLHHPLRFHEINRNQPEQGYRITQRVSGRGNYPEIWRWQDSGIFENMRKRDIYKMPYSYATRY